MNDDSYCTAKENFITNFIDTLSSSKKSNKSTIVQHLLSTIGEGRMKEFKEAASELGLHHCVKKMDLYETTSLMMNSSINLHQLTMI